MFKRHLFSFLILSFLFSGCVERGLSAPSSAHNRISGFSHDTDQATVVSSNADKNTEDANKICIDLSSIPKDSIVGVVVLSIAASLLL